MFAGDSRVSYREYPGLSHLFMPAGEVRSVKDYLKPAHVDMKVIDDISRWNLKPPPH